jgi:ABC-2 type transport system permease protein
MTWRTVARKNVLDARRSRTLWLLFGFLTLLFVGYAVGHGSLGQATFGAFLDALVAIVGLVVPALAILLGYRSISDGRASGSLLLELSLPTSRKQLIVGTVVGRTLVLLVPSLVTLAVAGIVGAVLYGTAGALSYVWFLLVTALYGAAFVGAAIGLSMSTTADRRITVGAVGGYLLLVVLWDSLISFGITVLHRFNPLVDMPDWGLLLTLAGPNEAYHRLLRVGVDTGVASQYVTGSTPPYVDWWAALLLLLLWIIVPLFVGGRRFSTADI